MIQMLIVYMKLIFCYRFMMEINSDTVKSIKKRLDSSLKLLEHYEWLINSFVLDFFHEGHWQTLPYSWQTFLENISPSQLADWLDSDSDCENETQPWPLSLLALKQSIKHLSLDRHPVKDLRNVAKFMKMEFNDNSNGWKFDPEIMSGASKHHESLKHVFRKHVKPKKQYEMCRLGKLCSSVANHQNVDKVLDIGSGGIV